MLSCRFALLPSVLCALLEGLALLSLQLRSHEAEPLAKLRRSRASGKFAAHMKCGESLLIMFSLGRPIGMPTGSKHPAAPVVTVVVVQPRKTLIVEGPNIHQQLLLSSPNRTTTYILHHRTTKALKSACKHRIVVAQTVEDDCGSGCGCRH